MKKETDAKRWLCIWVVLFAAGILGVSALTAWLDPFFHYHAPREGYYYALDNERAQNDGILRHFDYDAVITGTSMCQNFRTSEFDALFGTNAVKTCFAGATYREISDRLERAFASSGVRYVVRSLDLSYLISGTDEMRTDMGEYPEWLYNDALPDDIRYLYNLDVLSGYTLPMLAERLRGTPGGMTPFDEYAAWYRYKHFGTEEVQSAMDRSADSGQVAQKHMEEEDREKLHANLQQNILPQIREHPETTFFLFVPPVSVAFWKEQYLAGNALYWIEALDEAMRLLLPYENVRLFCFSADESITMEPDNYCDNGHYGPWINTMILESFYADDAAYRVTEDNRESMIGRMKELYAEP